MKSLPQSTKILFTPSSSSPSAATSPLSNKKPFVHEIENIDDEENVVDIGDAKVNDPQLEKAEMATRGVNEEAKSQEANIEDVHTEHRPNIHKICNYLQVHINCQISYIQTA